MKAYILHAPTRLRFACAASILAIGAALTANAGCTAEQGSSTERLPNRDGGSARTPTSDGGGPTGEAPPEVVPESGLNEVVTATVKTHLKTSTADSTALAEDEKCMIPAGGQVTLTKSVASGTHIGGLLASEHACGAKFEKGAAVFAFRSHFTGWSSALNPQASEVKVVDDPTNYASPCQYKAANRTGAEINRIVLHNTEGHWDSVKASWQSCDRIGAAHFIVLRDGVAIRTIPEKNIAYHAIRANEDSLGIEIEAGPGFAGMTAAQERSVISLTKKLQADFSVTRSAVTMHRLAAPGTTDCATYVWPKDAAFTEWRDRVF